jgi:hypothetical protein
VEVRSSEGLGRSAGYKLKLAWLPCPELGKCSEPDGEVRFSAATRSAARIASVVWKTDIGLLIPGEIALRFQFKLDAFIVAQLFALKYGTVLDPTERRQWGREAGAGTDQELVWTDRTAQRVGAERPCEPDSIEQIAKLLLGWLRIWLLCGLTFDMRGGQRIGAAKRIMNPRAARRQAVGRPLDGRVRQHLFGLQKLPHEDELTKPWI